MPECASLLPLSQSAISLPVQRVDIRNSMERFKPIRRRGRVYPEYAGSCANRRFVIATHGEMHGKAAIVALYVVALVAVVIGLDVMFFRNRFWGHLAKRASADMLAAVG